MKQRGKTVLKHETRLFHRPDEPMSKMNRSRGGEWREKVETGNSAQTLLEPFWFIECLSLQVGSQSSSIGVKQEKHLAICFDTAVCFFSKQTVAGNDREPVK
jgi:hypothetical protein